MTSLTRVYHQLFAVEIRAFKPKSLQRIADGDPSQQKKAPRIVPIAAAQAAARVSLTATNVRFGSEADMAVSARNVRFNSESGH